ncbi:NUDIX domain-containing protein [Rhizophagus clarus]|uniref:8-oxo-dGTP diphosphatase n=1 Tax=Rhizophagus clarus TaxID=94130 RepID=A0A8H3LHB6_9GLOM|nr:NUDIX domain-containing protein [Rhizophagus clarus]
MKRMSNSERRDLCSLYRHLNAKECIITKTFDTRIVNCFNTYEIDISSDVMIKGWLWEKIKRIIISLELAVKLFRNFESEQKISVEGRRGSNPSHEIIPNRPPGLSAKVRKTLSKHQDRSLYEQKFFIIYKNEVRNFTSTSKISSQIYNSKLSRTYYTGQTLRRRKILQALQEFNLQYSLHLKYIPDTGQLKVAANPFLSNYKQPNTVRNKNDDAVYTFSNSFSALDDESLLIKTTNRNFDVSTHLKLITNIQSLKDTPPSTSTPRFCVHNNSGPEEADTTSNFLHSALRGKSVKWKEPLEEFKENESVKQILKRPTYVMNILYQDNGIYLSKRCQKNKEMYNLWQVPGGKVELEESSIQAVLRKTQEETGIKLKKEELTYLFNDPNFNCDIYATKLISSQKLEHTEPDKQGPWELFNWNKYKEMANQKLTTPTHVTYIEEILKSLIKEKSTYVHQIEEVKEALFGEAEVYGGKVNVLIDSEAVGCIISKRYLDKVNKAIDTSTSVRIIDVTGKKTAPLGLVRQVPIKIRDIETRMDMIVTESQEYNVLLGNIWLKYVIALFNLVRPPDF